MTEHHYCIKTEWTGNLGEGTATYQSYSRDHLLSGAGKATPIEGSSDPVFRGDPTRYNPEELLVSALSACHMLWYLHLCALNHLIVTDYIDEATGSMSETADGSGQFREVTLKPVVTVAEPSMVEPAEALHREANRRCFIAKSCTFPVHHQPLTLVRP